MLLAGVIRTSERRHGSDGEMYANQRHMMEESGWMSGVCGESEEVEEIGGISDVMICQKILKIVLRRGLEMC